jgi:SAM-dependent methyltransferase
MIIKIFNFLTIPFILIRDLIIEKKLNNISEKERFTLFHESKYWKPMVGGSLSGAGSSIEATKVIRQSIHGFFKKYNIRSMLDAPCGDWHWMREVKLQGINYIGGDIVNEIVKQNNKKYSSSNISFIELDIVNDVLPKVDLIFVRDCLVHLEDEDIITALRNIVRSKSKYLVVTTYPKNEKNEFTNNKDRWRELNLTKAPFFLPDAIELLPDTYSHYIDKDKYMGVWEIDNLFKKSLGI